MPAKFVSNKDETIPLFENPLLERLTHIHPATPAVLFLPIAGWFLWQGLHGGVVVHRPRPGPGGVVHLDTHRVLAPSLGLPLPAQEPHRPDSSIS